MMEHKKPHFEHASNLHKEKKQAAEASLEHLFLFVIKKLSLTGIKLSKGLC